MRDRSDRLFNGGLCQMQYSPRFESSYTMTLDIALENKPQLSPANPE